MISAILSFLGGSAFRMIWGEFSSWLNKKQDHAYELERMDKMEGYEAARHQRQMDSMRFQAEQAVKVIQVQSEGHIAELEAGAWLKAVEGTTKAVGVKWVDAWNASIRPGVATWAVVMLSLEALALLKLSEGSAAVCFAALGLYLADRTLAKRGK